MQCWNVVNHHSNQRAMHKNLVLKRKREEVGSVCKRKVRLVKYRNEKNNLQRRNILSCDRLCNIKARLVSFYTTEMENESDRFWKRITKGSPRKVIICRASKITVPRGCPTTQVMKLKRSSYGLRDAAKVCKKSLFRKVTELGLKDSKTCPCVSVKEELAILCFLEELILFARRKSGVDDVRRVLNKTIRLNNLG